MTTASSMARPPWSRITARGAGWLLLVLALALVLPHLRSGTEMVRLRNALTLGPDLPLNEDWQPPAFPADFKRETQAPDTYFVDIAQRLGLAGLPNEWARVQAIGRHVLASAPKLNGGAIQSDLKTTHQRITVQGGGYCGDFVRVFTAIAHAAGLTVRPWSFSFDGYGGHGHIWVEYWNSTRGQWVLIDIFNNYHFSSATGEPLSAMALRKALASPEGAVQLQVLVPEARPGFRYADSYWGYVRRGLDQWYTTEGNNVTSVDADALVRLGGSVSRAMAGVAAIVSGVQPEVRMLAVPESEDERAAMRSLRTRLALALALGLAGLGLLLVSLRSRAALPGGRTTRAASPVPTTPSGTAQVVADCLAVYSPLFPHQGQPQAGLFIRERMFRVLPPRQLVVIAPQPWFPLQGLIRFWRPHYRPEAARFECQQAVDVWFPRFLSLPGVLRRLDGLSMALCTWPLMRRLQRSRGLAIIDAHFAYPAGAAAVLLGRWLTLPVTITLRGTELRQLTDPVLKPRVLAALAGASRVFSVSASLREAAVAAGADAARIHVVGNGVDLGKFRRLPREQARSRLDLPQDSPVLVSVGGLVDRKGFHRVIELLPELRRRLPGLMFLIVGGPSPEGDIRARLEAQVATLGLADAVRFLGPLPPEALCEPLSAADVFVLATANEGWANVLLEAMACGLPVVTTDVGGNREVVSDTALGTVVPFGDPLALRQAIEAAFASPWNRDAIVRHAGANQWNHRVQQLREHFSHITRGAVG